MESNANGMLMESLPLEDVENCNHIVAFHNDADGVAAAICACEFLETKCKNQVKNRVEYIPLSYSDNRKFWQIIGEFIGSGHQFIVHILDFSMTPDQMITLLEISKQLVWIDHHVSVMDALDNRPNDDDIYRRMITRINGGTDCFNMEKLHGVFDPCANGACNIAYQYYCYSSEIYGSNFSNVPALIKYIADRDRWTFNLDDSMAINAGLRLAYNRFKVGSNAKKYIKTMREVYASSRLPIESYKTSGETLIKYWKQTVTEALNNGGKLEIHLEECDLTCGLVFLAGWGEDIGEIAHFIFEAAEEQQNQTSKAVINSIANSHVIAIAYIRNNGKIGLSFRSHNVISGMPTAVDFAKAIGGGGATDAAGGMINMNELISTVFHNFEIMKKPMEVEEEAPIA